ncbi:MAG: DUF3179 domain-containing protein [Haloferacaceae archaeon]
MNVERVLPRDAIPSVDDPEFVPVDAPERVDPDPGDVIVVDPDSLPGAGRADDAVRAGDAAAKAYPVRYLHFHEIVNDALAGVPVAVTWCPLCGSAVVYESRVEVDGGQRTLEFGVSGKLADDDLVMYDRETESEWKQSLGRAIAGPLEGTKLAVLPASMVAFEAFRSEYPDGVVMAPPGGASEAASDGDDPAPIDYDDAPYEAYFRGEGFGLGAHRGTGGREWDRDDFAPKAVVLGIERADDALGFPLPVVKRRGGVATATVGGLDVVVFAADGELYAYEDPGFDWRRARGGFRGDDALYDPATGRPIDAPAAHTGESGAAGAEPLTRVPSRRLFAFAWQDDHGPGAFLS